MNIFLWLCLQVAEADLGALLMGRLADALVDEVADNDRIGLHGADHAAGEVRSEEARGFALQLKQPHEQHLDAKLLQIILVSNFYDRLCKLVNKVKPALDSAIGHDAFDSTYDSIKHLPDLQPLVDSLVLSSELAQ